MSDTSLHLWRCLYRVMCVCICRLINVVVYSILLGNLCWLPRMKPQYWPDDILFTDPNNDKKNKPALTEIVKFLVGQAKLHSTVVS